MAVLLEHGCVVDLQSGFHSTTAAHLACKYGHHACLKLLLDAKASPRPVGGGEVVGGVAPPGAQSPLVMAVQSDSAECVRLLVAAHADLEEKSRDDAVANQMTALCNAAAYGKVHGARALLDLKAQANFSGDGVTPLMLATHKCHPDVVELLVQYRADIDRTISMEHVTGGKTLMRAVDLGKSQLNGVINAREQAAREGQPNLADRDEEIRGFQKCIDLLERAEAMIRAPSGLDPATYLGGYDAALVRSVHRNNLFEVLTLLEGRASPDAHWLEEGKRDHTALGTAAQGGLVEAVRLLLAAGAKPNECTKATPDCSSTTPLQIASASGAEGAVRLLLNAKADPQLAPEGSTFTPLEGALAAKSASVMRLLIAAGAKPASSQLIATFIHTARSAGAPEECVALLEGREVPDPAVVFQEGDNTAAHLEWATLLTNICTTGGEPVSALAVRLCLACGASPDIPIGLGMSLLTHLCMKGEAECVRLLLEARASPLEEDDAQPPWFSLHVACASSHPECAALLIAARAPVRCRSERLHTPLLFATRDPDDQGGVELGGRHTCARLLLRADRALKTGARAERLAASNDYCFALTRAVLNDDGPMVKLLLEEGVSPDVRFAPNAAQNKDIEAGRLKPKGEEGGNMTLLFGAVKFSKLKSLVALLEGGADPNVKVNGRTPLDLAKKLPGRADHAEVLQRATKAWGLVGKWVQVSNDEKPKLHGRCAYVEGIELSTPKAAAGAAGTPDAAAAAAVSAAPVVRHKVHFVDAASEKPTLLKMRHLVALETKESRKAGLPAPEACAEQRQGNLCARYLKLYDDADSEDAATTEELESAAAAAAARRFAPDHHASHAAAADAVAEHRAAAFILVLEKASDDGVLPLVVDAVLGRTPPPPPARVQELLLVAASTGDDAAVQLLLDASAAADAVCAGGWTPIALAASRGGAAALRRLLAAAAAAAAERRRAAVTALEDAGDEAGAREARKAPALTAAAAAALGAAASVAALQAQRTCLSCCCTRAPTRTARPHARRRRPAG